MSEVFEAGEVSVQFLWLVVYRFGGKAMEGAVAPTGENVDRFL